MIKRKNDQNKTLQEHHVNGVLYFTFPSLDAVETVLHGFSSRIGGVSDGVLSSMNLSFARGDQPERVRENFRRIADAIGFREEDMVFSHQTHTNHVRVITEEDKGKGYMRERDYQDVDGLVTNVPGIVLVTFYADCVPLYFVDPVHHAIGLSHSGWRGTVSDIAGETVRTMAQKYGSKPEDIIAAIGPSICKACYEVSEDVIEQIRAVHEKEVWKDLFEQKENGKYQLDLWETCRRNLIRAGVTEDHIEVTDVCTCCNPDLLFSHRASGGKRGNLAGFLGIREK